MLQCLEPAAVSPLGRRRVTQQVLRDPDGEPERENPFPARTARGPRQGAQQRGGRRVPAGHASVRVSVVNTISGRISRMQR